jgi:hypothetical protein
MSDRAPGSTPYANALESTLKVLTPLSGPLGMHWAFKVSMHFQDKEFLVNAQGKSAWIKANPRPLKIISI